MSYAKQTWADASAGNTPVNAARLNHMEDGIAAAAVLTDLPYALARQTTAQTGLAAGFNAIVYNTTEFDSHSGFSGSTYTVPAGQGGIYRISGQVTILATSAANGYIGIRMEKNGAIMLGGWGDLTGVPSASAVAGYVGATFPGRLISLAAGDTVRLDGYASWSSWATATAGFDNGSWMAVERVR